MLNSFHPETPVSGMKLSAISHQQSGKGNYFYSSFAESCKLIAEGIHLETTVSVWN